ncbi:hypothetical protein RJ640_022996 [Escallonia rubra]|uniref:Bifunctional inhibitor/plant lipid transfer protein/seed storage helical domain-containing protein n=1 Tax=Escallonia rubra TaxID=112253 RepID=A0AA88RFF8_9ASTE|nr:hypothetical protein RJ640_022996 [Escallonia rubra]
MAAMKTSLIRLTFVLVVALLLNKQMAQPLASQTCSAGLGNLNVCAPFVVPGVTNSAPSADCCGALQSVQHDCLCNTLRIAARLPAQCNLPPLACGGQRSSYVISKSTMK